MTASKLVLNAASTAGGGATTDVSDVFSTFLYTGNNDDGKSRGINNGIALGNFGTGSSTDFDGTASPLRRTSALSGLSDGKQFTFSFWINFDEGDVTNFAAISFNTFYFTVYGNENQLQFVCRNSSNTNILYAEINEANPRLFSQGIWYHILVSIDLTNSSNRYIYINDVSKASSTTWNTYTNDNIDFTQSTIDIADFTGQSASYSEPCKLAHMYLDTTYRDLSTTSNRRIFIDANGGSTSASSLSALNPVLYLPLTNDYAITKNLGTGGDFTSSGAPKIDTTIGTEYDSTAGQGGLVWIKDRTGSGNHWLWDTERGATKSIATNTANGNIDRSNGLTAFNSNGFTLGNYGGVNANTYDFASWTWRKAPKFFDIQTWTGTGSARTISHNLGQVPGVIIVKRYSSTEDWNMFHRSLGNTKYLQVNGTGQAGTSGTGGGQANLWNDTDPTSTEFTIGTHDRVNTNGQSYIAYIFAHNDSGDGGFGPDGDQDIIKCGSYTNSGSTVSVNLGFEPQFIMFKRYSGTGSWFVADSMRGIINGSTDPSLVWDSSAAESNTNAWDLTPTGFDINGAILGSGDYIYMAIRRGPLAAPTDATKVFAIDTGNGNGSSSSPEFVSGFPVDLALLRPTSIANNNLYSRLTANKYLSTNSTASETTDAANYRFDSNTGWYFGSTTYTSWMWKRAPSYFDVVAFSKTTSGAQNVSHNLGAVPEMMWIKVRNDTDNWTVYHKDLGNDKRLILNSTDAATGSNSIFFNNTTPTATQFTIGSIAANSYNFIAYLFATVAGVSKVGSVSHSFNSTTNVDCGFAAGARFVLVKSTAAGYWRVWDSVRGIVAGNDPYLHLNDTSAEVTNGDFIDPYASGFALSPSFYSDTYIFYAIA